jgi:predicted metallo-beta-lactamase superfamily hydrolase
MTTKKNEENINRSQNSRHQYFQNSLKYKVCRKAGGLLKKMYPLITTPFTMEKESNKHRRCI